MFQFRRFPSYAYLIQRRMTEYCSAGFPHSEISGSKAVCASPKLIAACHVLLRLLMPRHSPCALISLTSRRGSPHACRTVLTVLQDHELCRLSEFFRLSCCLYPLTEHPFGRPANFHNILAFALCCLLLALLSALFSFQGADPPASFKTRYKRSTLKRLYLSLMVEIIGLEPMTPCLQSRCSPS